MKKEAKIRRGLEPIHESLKFVLIVAQCFSQIPVQGITALDARALHFKWLSWKVFYSCLTFTGTGFMLAMHIYDVFKNGFHFFIISGIIFFFNTSMASLLFLRMALRWPKLMRKLTLIEVSMQKYDHHIFLKRRIKILTIFFLLLAAVEHSLVQISKLIISFKCQRETGSDALRHFFVDISYERVFTVFEYNVWKALLLQAVNILSTFAWTFIDLFIMVISSIPALKLRQITFKIQQLSTSKESSEIIWKREREVYSKIQRFCKLLDQEMWNLILLSFANNSYFIINQLFNSLRKLDDGLSKISFFFSFGFVILRTCGVVFYAAWVNDESLKPMHILHSIPSSIFNIEIERFIKQISLNSVCLTGRKFFRVTRSLIFNISATVVTYELVLIQFNGHLLAENVATNNFTHC